MRRVAAAVALLTLAACGGPNPIAGDLAAATFVVSFPSTGAEVVAHDRIANTTETENRLDVIRPSGDPLVISPVYASTPQPDPFEFIRNPLTKGSLAAFLEGTTTVVAVVYPLVDPTPNGRVLAASLIGLDASGQVVLTDWDAEGDRRITALMAWGAEQGLSPVDTIQKAIAGLNEPGADPIADEAADLVSP